jgi:type IV secretory pathway VirB10-like protein
MNRIFVISCLTAIISASAQDAPKPQLRTTPPSPLAPPPISESEALPLIPEGVEQREQPRGTGTALAEPKKNKTSEAENELTARVRMRELKTRALRDAKVRAEWERAQTARTDAEKRDALTAYYTQLYTKMGEFDGSIKKRADLLKETSIRRITQRRVAPSEILEPIAEELRSER